MNTTDRGMRLKSEPRAVKREPGAFIKSEFGPSLASLPMSPPKKEHGDNKKSFLSSIPEHRPSRRRRRGTHMAHRIDGYYIRAHYGNGKVEFVVNKDNPKCRDLDWKEVEREMFRKFHAARFFIEPVERPYIAIQKFSLGAAARTLQFSVRVRRLVPTAAPTSSSSRNANPSEAKAESKPFSFLSSGLFNATKAEEKQPAQGPVAGKTSQPELVYPAASLPANLPEILSYSIIDSDKAKAARTF